MKAFDHTRPDFEPYGFTCELWTAAPMRRPDRHNEVELNLLRNGSLTYQFGGERVTLSHGSLTAFWAAIPHQITGFSGAPEYFVITLPLSWFLQCRLPPALVDRLLHAQVLRDPTPGRFDLDLQLCQCWASDLNGNADDPSAAIRLELQARLLRFAQSLPRNPELSDGGSDRPGAIVGEGGAGKVELLAAFIGRHYQDPIRIDDIARAVGLHPNYAMSLFKRTFNLTINEYLTQHRLAHAQRLLATTDAKVVDIALDSGYPTLSRFYEAFKQSCGCSPSRYRKEHRDGG